VTPEPKRLLPEDLLAIIGKALMDPDVIEELEPYRRFLMDLGNAVAGFAGGEPDFVEMRLADGDNAGGYNVAFYLVVQHNDSVPSDGGVYRDYDKEHDWNTEAPDAP